MGKSIGGGTAEPSQHIKTSDDAHVLTRAINKKSSDSVKLSTGTFWITSTDPREKKGKSD